MALKDDALREVLSHHIEFHASIHDKCVNTFQVRIQGLARDACIEHVHVVLGG